MQRKYEKLDAMFSFADLLISRIETLYSGNETSSKIFYQIC